MTTNKKVESLADFKGQKIRTMENSYHMAYWKALGASPTPMTFSEVYIGLQQGTIDAQENPYEVIVSNKLYEQQDYVVETNHLPHLISLIVSDEFFEGLTGEQQEIIREAAETAKEYAREQSDERIASRIQTIEESGTQIISLSDEMYEQIRELCKPVYESIEKNVSEDLVDAYLAAFEHAAVVGRMSGEVVQRLLQQLLLKGFDLLGRAEFDVICKGFHGRFRISC